MSFAYSTVDVEVWTVNVRSAIIGNLPWGDACQGFSVGPLTYVGYGFLIKPGYTKSGPACGGDAPFAIS